MPSWLSDRFGADLAPLIGWVAAAAIVIVLIVLVMLAARKLLGPGGVGVKGRGPRLQMLDVAVVDQKRKLILIRRDDVEHLILIGGQNDIVIEAGIGRIPLAARIRAEPSDLPQMRGEGPDAARPRAQASGRVDVGMPGDLDRGSLAPGARGGQPEPLRQTAQRPAARQGRLPEARNASPLSRPVPRPAALPLADALTRREAETEPRSDSVSPVVTTDAAPQSRTSGFETLVTPSKENPVQGTAPVWPMVQSPVSEKSGAAEIVMAQPLPPNGVSVQRPPETAPEMRVSMPYRDEADELPSAAVAEIAPFRSISGLAVSKPEGAAGGEAALAETTEPSGEPRPEDVVSAQPAENEGLSVAPDVLPPVPSNRRAESWLLQKPVALPDRSIAESSRRPSTIGSSGLPTPSARAALPGQSTQMRSLATPTRPKTVDVNEKVESSPVPQAESREAEDTGLSPSSSLPPDIDGLPGSSDAASGEMLAATDKVGGNQPAAVSAPTQIADGNTAASRPEPETPGQLLNADARRAPAASRSAPTLPPLPAPRQTSLAGLLGSRSAPTRPNAAPPSLPDADRPSDGGSEDAVDVARSDGLEKSAEGIIDGPNAPLRPTSSPRSAIFSSPTPVPEQAPEGERRSLSVRSFATAIQSRKASDPILSRPARRVDPVAPVPPQIPDVLSSAPTDRPAPSSPDLQTSQKAPADTSGANLDEFLSAELDQDFKGTDWGDVDNRRKAAQGSSEDRLPETVSSSQDESSVPDSPLTLEEEMERLLGDFDFEVSERKAGGRPSE